MTEESSAPEIDPALLLPILIAPHPVLKAKARPVVDADREIVRELIPRMFATMYKAPGIGLAAPQIGQLLRLFVVDVAREGEKSGPIAMINPELVAFSDEKNAYEEGCLSLPQQFAEVIRPRIVKVRFEDAQGMKREIDADGLLATCIQHEYDHLNGILFVDHISSLKRNMIMRKLSKEQKLKAMG